MKLDKSKSYGIISGGHFGAAFEQDGRCFDADGEEVVTETIETKSSEDLAAQKAIDDAAAAEALAKKEADEAADAAQAASDAKAKAETPAPAKNKGGRPPKAQSAIDDQIAAQGGQ